MRFSAVILAGGESRRMGRDKAWIEVAGESLLSRAVLKARRAGASEVFISGRRGVDYSGLECPVLLDARTGRGPLGGIERALDAATHSLLLVLAVDVPGVTAALLRRLISRCEGITGVVPTLRGELEPLVAVYPKRCHGLVTEALRRHRWRAREFAETCLRAGAVRTLRVAAAERGRFRNWNSPADLPAQADWSIRTGG